MAVVLMNKSFPILFALIFLLSALFTLDAEAQWVKDTRLQMEIDNTINIHSSEAHLYVLSESEGLVVFRVHDDSVQWLYSSTGMQQRGHLLDGDIRFAYLYGDTPRLTVIEPTSVLGVYSSTVLPATPRSVKRIGNNLYIALGQRGLGMLSLESPESVDSDVQYIDADRFEGSSVMSLATDDNQVLYVLSGSNTIDVYEIGSDENDINHDDRVTLSQPVEKIFLTESELFGTDQSGQIFSIRSNGQTSLVADVEQSVTKLQSWNDRLVVRTETASLWIEGADNNLVEWRSDERAGNHFAVTGSQLWMSDFDQISRVVERNQIAGSESSRSAVGSDQLSLKPINNVILPFPRPLILPIELENELQPGNISFSYEAPFNNARIRGNSFYWQPSANQTGTHRVTITGTTADGQSDSVDFTIELRPFNAPPRFSPGRPMTIPVGESFEFTINAVDPDGMNRNLIRYLGVDMPSGANLNEQTGEFTWTPTVRQVGEHEFRVIATDQFGAASSQNYTLNIIEINEEEEQLQDNGF